VQKVVSNLIQVGIQGGQEGGKTSKLTDFNILPPLFDALGGLGLG
jgi:hypothetical protein